MAFISRVELQIHMTIAHEWGVTDPSVHISAGRDSSVITGDAGDAHQNCESRGAKVETAVFVTYSISARPVHVAHADRPVGNDLPPMRATHSL